MNARKWIRASALTLVTMCCMLADSGRSGQDSTRDITRYDKTGPFTIDPDRHQGDPSVVLPKIRYFLWEHITKRQLGRFVLTYISKEGDKTTNEFFVEPRATGVWQVVVESKSVTRRSISGQEQSIRERSRSAYDVLERIEPLADGLTTPVTISEEEVRQPKTYWLRLTNRDTGEHMVL